MTPLLEVEDLRVTFQTRYATIEAVRGIGFAVREGETLAIVGESGSGKTAAALAIADLLSKEGSLVKGKILLQGVDLLSLPTRARRHARGGQMGVVFQDPMTSLNPLMKIGRQITETIRHRKGVTRDEAKRRACRLLERVGIAEADRRFNQYPHEFSGGMRQRVMIALALACEPKLLIADEPTTALDVTIQAQILELLQTVQRESGTSILLITHDLGVVAQVADRMVVMYAGQIAEQGKTEPLFAAPAHPYTRALLASVPRGGLQAIIPGSPPDLSHPPPGCPFAPRCPYAMGICKQRRSSPYSLSPNQISSCWLHHPKAKGQRELFLQEKR
ncbi:MAG: ABC transporter ATP-binding protein [Parachlamydiales bacterium]